MALSGPHKGAGTTRTSHSIPDGRHTRLRKLCFKHCGKVSGAVLSRDSAVGLPAVSHGVFSNGFDNAVTTLLRDGYSL